MEPISVNEVFFISPAGPDDEETLVDEEYYEVILSSSQLKLSLKFPKNI